MRPIRTPQPDGEPDERARKRAELRREAIADRRAKFEELGYPFGVAHALAGDLTISVAAFQDLIATMIDAGRSRPDALELARRILL